MRKFMFVGFVLIWLLGTTVYGDGIRVPPEASPNLLASLHITVIHAWELAGDIGRIVTQLGQAAPNVLGCLTCLVLPMAWLGAWALSRLPRILGLMTLRDNVRSFFKD
ncbi:MAG: hypothetical protein N2559_10865 [Anaerolineae bacterium]|nr:hypothetical protein [Anaerolineae bacterium]